MCQVENVKEIACKPPFSLKMEQIYWKIRKSIGKVKLLKNLKHRLTFKKNPRYQILMNSTGVISSSKKIDENGSNVSGKLKSEPLKAGDRVRILTKEKLAQLLDKNNKYKGCFFMDEMWQYCGTEQKVLTRVEYFYDEMNAIMRKAKNTMLLEGLYCSGDMHWKHKCDRNCFFFWREEWLDKI